MLVSVVLQGDGTQADRASAQILPRIEGAGTAHPARDILVYRREPFKGLQAGKRRPTPTIRVAPGAEIEDVLGLDCPASYKVVVGGRRRLDDYLLVKRLRAAHPGANLVLVVQRAHARELRSDLARIRRLSNACRDLGCRVKYCLPLSSLEALRETATAALGAGASLIELPVSTTQLGANSKTPELADVVREIEASGPAKELFDEPGTTPESGKHRRVGALICARVKSARMPGKALVEIAGVEAITLLIERLKTSAACGQIVLCTTTAVEDQALAAIGEREKIGVFRGSSSNVAGRLLGAVRQFGLDDFVRVTGDDPLCCVDLIDLAVESHLRHGADYTHMTGVFLGGDSEVVSARAVETVAERAVKSENTEYLSWYLDDRTVFAVNRMTVDAKYWRPYRLTLDTPEDLEVIRAVYAALYEPGKIVDSLEALEWLDRNEEIARINRDIRSPVERSDLNLDLNL